MKIAILGTRGIPNFHGGFEQFAEYFSVYLVEKGHEVYVYNSHLHPYKEDVFKGVNIIHCKDWEDKIGTAGQFIYDLNCILNSRKHSFDIILQLGYTSSTIWHWLLPKKSIVVTNMDGLEWKRSKYSPLVRQFLKYAEKLGAKYSDFLVADSLGIQDHLKSTYNKPSTYIPYGAKVFNTPKEQLLATYEVEAGNFDMLIARMEPENNIETILDGIANSKDETTFLVVGKNEANPFGRHLTKKYKAFSKIRFLGGIYNIEHLDNLRYFSRFYFHGHSVGGTNPSLLEAMASNTTIVAHSNIFNRAILGTDALYFETAEQVTQIISGNRRDDYSHFAENNRKKIDQLYDWNLINQQYLELLESVNNS